jgi:hypothetical protein
MTRLGPAWRYQIFTFISIALLSAVMLLSHIGEMIWLRAVTSSYALALFAYLGSHLFRIARLSALAADDSRAVYFVSPAHLLSAPLGFFLPYKLGEIFRIIILVTAFERPKKGLFVWLLERVGDVLVLVAVTALLLLIGSSHSFNAGALILSFAGIGIMLLLSFWAIFDLSSFLIEVLVLRSRSKVGFFLLRQLAEFRYAALIFARSMNGRLLTLFVTSMFIWIFEICAFSILSGGSLAAGDDFSTVLESILLPDRGPVESYANVAASSQLLVFLSGLSLTVAFWHKVRTHLRKEHA